MTVSRLTVAESYELANLVRNIGVKNVLLILRKAASPKKAKRLYKVQQLPTDIRARVAVMLSSRRYTQKDILSYVNNEIEHRGLADKFKISRTAFNRFLNEEIYPSLSNQ
ncbi:DUF3486 family protein [Vibrio parahaemolyticus]|nr:DUF3486 family protein [Vibrio parahaemolyticus]